MTSRAGTLLFVALATYGCQASPPDVCERLQSSPFEHPLSFKSYEADGCTPEEWRGDLTAQVRAAVGLPEHLSVPAPTVTSGILSWARGRTEYTVPSSYDGIPVPYYVVKPDPDVAEKQHVVLILHGHGETWNAPFQEDSQLHNLGGILLEEGYLVAVPEIRSFGDFKIGGEGHDEYVAGLPPGVFMGQIISDTVSVAMAVVNGYAERGLKISMIGHSLGGYLAQHVGALTPGFANVMTSGSFSPYGCINTNVHCNCEALPEMLGMAELYDVAGMASPDTSVDVLFGARDSSLSMASIQMYEELFYIFETTGAPRLPGFSVSVKSGHEIDPDQVLDALSSS